MYIYIYIRTIIVPSAGWPGHLLLMGYAVRLSKGFTYIYIYIYIYVYIYIYTYICLGPLGRTSCDADWEYIDKSRKLAVEPITETGWSP